MYKYMFLITLPTIAFTSDKFFSNNSTSSSSDDETYTVFIDPNYPRSCRITNNQATISIPISNESPFYIKKIASNGNIITEYRPPHGYEKTIYDFFKLSKQGTTLHSANKHTEK